LTGIETFQRRSASASTCRNACSFLSLMTSLRAPTVFLSAISIGKMRLVSWPSTKQLRSSVPDMVIVVEPIVDEQSRSGFDRDGPFSVYRRPFKINCDRYTASFRFLVSELRCTLSSISAFPPSSLLYIYIFILFSSSDTRSARHTSPSTHNSGGNTSYNGGE